MREEEYSVEHETETNFQKKIYVHRGVTSIGSKGTNQSNHQEQIILEVSYLPYRYKKKFFPTLVCSAPDENISAYYKKLFSPL